MLKNRMMLGVVTASAVIVPFVGVTALTAGQAGAKTPKGIKCTSLSGKSNTSTGAVKESLSGCSGKTGGSGKSKSSGSSSTSTLKWANGKSTTFTASTGAGSGCASGDFAEAISGNVTADTTGSTAVGAAVTASACYNPANNKISLAPGTKFVIAG